MTVKQVSDLSLREAGQRFMTSLKASNRYSPSYLDSLERTVALAALYSEEQGWPTIRYVTTDHVEEYLAYLQTRPRWFGEREKANPRNLSQGHINGQYRRLHRFFNWLVEREHVERNPLEVIQAPHVDEKTVPVVSEHQMRDLLTLTDPALARTRLHRFRLLRNRAVLYVLWDTPGRLNEIAKLDLGRVDLEEGAVKVMGKGRKERWMPIGNATQSVLWDYLQARESVHPKTGSLWVSEHGRPMEPNGIYQMLKRLGDRAGISDLHTHQFRHSYAMNALRAGMPERVLKIIGGWKKIPDTYFKTLDAEDAQRFHRQVSPGDKLGKTRSARTSGLRQGHSHPRGKL